nr:MAG TPA: hypothetical protein [Caudoviricetes sp.]
MLGLFILEKFIKTVDIYCNICYIINIEKGGERHVKRYRNNDGVD